MNSVAQPGSRLPTSQEQTSLESASIARRQARGPPVQRARRRRSPHLMPLPPRASEIARSWPFSWDVGCGDPRWRRSRWVMSSSATVDGASQADALGLAATVDGSEYVTISDSGLGSPRLDSARRSLLAARSSAPAINAGSSGHPAVLNDGKVSHLGGFRVMRVQTAEHTATTNSASSRDGSVPSLPCLAPSSEA
jgi:hypothetical protein